MSADNEALVARLTRPRQTDADVRGARSALQELYQHYAPAVLAFLASRFRFADDVAEDIHQTVWLRVLERAPAQFDGGNFRAWLYTIARNTALDFLRKKKLAPDAAPDSRPDPRSGLPLERLLDAERRTALARCLEKLDPARRELVTARLAGDNYPELARRFAVPEKNLYQWWSRAVEQLRACVEGVET